MKLKITLLAITLFTGLMTVNAQTDKQMQTLFDKGEITYGGYGGTRVAFSSFAGHDTWLVGGRGGAIFNNSFVIGGAGYGIVNSPKFVNVVENEVAYLEGGYGGMLLEYILMPHKLVHLSFPLVIGAGGLLYSDTPATGGTDIGQSILANTAFFVVEPGVELELNVVKFMRLSVGATYRYASGIDLPNTSSTAFNGLSGTFSLKFGKF